MSYSPGVDSGGVQPWKVGTDTMSGSAASGTGLTAAASYCYTFELGASTTFSGMEIDMAATVTGTVDLGVFDVNGNQLAHTGTVTPTANGTSTFNFSGGNITLAPGKYILAACPSNNTDTYFRKTAMPPGMSRCYTGTNAGTNTSGNALLPSTLGTLVASGVCICMSMLAVGGAP